MAAFILIDGTVFSVYAMACALWHELSHIIVLRLAGGRVRHLTAEGFGLKLDTAVIGYREETAVALAGPIASALGALVFAIAFFIRPTRVFLFILISNLSLFMLNILPVYPLDGGRAVYCMLCRRFDIQRAEHITRVVSTAFLVPLTVAAIILLIRSGYNLSLLLICIYLIITLTANYY